MAKNLSAKGNLKYTSLPDKGDFYSSGDLLSRGLQLSEAARFESYNKEPLFDRANELYEVYLQLNQASRYDFIDAYQLISGTNYADHIQGSSGNDAINGFAGDDWIAPGKGNDIVRGGEPLSPSERGIDIVDYSNADGAVEINLNLQGTSQDTGSMGHDTLIGIEGISGSQYGDRLIGDNGNNSIYGNAGDDQIEGRSGNDSIVGGAGNDDIWGGRGDDIIYSTDNDGDDVIYGGAGSDLLDFTSVSEGVYVSLTAGVASYQGSEDQIHGIENIAGSQFDDIIIGNTANNYIDGGNGKDFINGGGGNDILFGGYDLIQDDLYGNFGSDTFVWQVSDKVFGGEDAYDTDVDTVILGGNVALFDSNDAALMSGIEVINMKDNSTDWNNSPTTVRLNAQDILSMTSGDGKLTIFGDANDSVLLVDSDGAGGYHWVHSTNGSGQDVYTWSGDSNIQVTVDAETQVQANLYA